MNHSICARILPGDSAFEEIASQLAQALREKQVTFFAGAGVSRPSGLPDSAALVESLIDAMIESLSMTYDCENTVWDEVKNVLAKSYPLEQLLNSLAGTNGEEAVLEYLKVLEGADENYNHTAIAELAVQGQLDHIVTLNFDVLFELALSKPAFSNRQVSFKWHLPLAGNLQIPEGPAQVTVVKPHGTLPFDDLPYERYYLAETLSSAGDRPQQETAKALKAIAEKSPVLVVAGYNSKADWDIFPILRACRWSHIIWCEFVEPDDLGNPLRDRPYDPVRQWLLTAPVRTTILYGDVRVLWSTILADGRSTGAWTNAPMRPPDTKVFLRWPGRTAFAALRLLDGKTTKEFYERLLTIFGATPYVANDPRLRRQWQRSMSWFYHAYNRDYRTEIRMRHRLIRQRPQSNPPDIDYLGDLLALCRGHLSAAKRLFLDFQLPLDLLKAYCTARVLRKEATKLEFCSDPYICKQARSQVEHLAFYKVDLCHDSAYFLLPFSNWLTKGLTTLIFRIISKQYRELIKQFPVFDWEYHLLRRVEAALIANKDDLVKEAEEKLKDNEYMFVRTGGNLKRPDHLAYLRALQAIIKGSREKEKFSRDSEETFREAAEPFLDDSYGATPSGKLRMRLLHRYFWPQSVPLRQLLQDFIRYARVQKKSGPLKSNLPAHMKANS